MIVFVGGAGFLVQQKRASEKMNRGGVVELQQNQEPAQESARESIQEPSEKQGEQSVDSPSIATFFDHSFDERDNDVF